MIILLSPAKTLDMTPLSDRGTTKPVFQSQANQLVKVLREKKSKDLMQLMSISEKLAAENVIRYQNFKQRVSTRSGKQAMYTFNGDVYRGLGAEDFKKSDEAFAQDHLRILSGLYGILKPLDLLQPYRLEMGTRLSTDHGKNLYDFWGDKVVKEVNKSLKKQKQKIIINLASDEYFKVLPKDKIDADIIHPNFKEYRDNKLKFISFSAKVARGLMARYIIKNKITNPEELKGFDLDGYSFSPDHSGDQSWIFVR